MLCHQQAKDIKSKTRKGSYFQTDLPSYLFCFLGPLVAIKQTDLKHIFGLKSTLWSWMRFFFYTFSIGIF